MDSILATTQRNGANLIQDHAITETLDLAKSAVYLTAGLATAATVQRALDSLRDRMDYGDKTETVFAFVSPYLAGIMRASGRFADVEIIEVSAPSGGPSTEYSMLTMPGGVYLKLEPTETRVKKERPQGWRRWLTPWARETVVFSSARVRCAIADHGKVQAIETPVDVRSNMLALFSQETKGNNV